LFWEIARTKNYNLLYLDYSEETVYTESQCASSELRWDDLYDEFYLLKKDSTAVMAIEKQNDTVEMLFKINILRDNLNSLNLLYESKDLIADASRFLELEQMFYANFKTIDKRINIKYFEGLKANNDVVLRFILSLESSYDLNHKRAEQGIEKEVKNVYTIIARVGTLLGMQLNAKEMNVKEFLAYEKEAIDKAQAQKEVNDGK
jgi:hypothetical protein